MTPTYNHAPASAVPAQPLNLTRKRLAFHEAGHAVAALVLGGRCLRVSIVPGADDLGRATVALVTDPSISITCDYAGIAAEEARYGAHGLGHHDLRNVRAEAARAGLGRRRLDELWTQALELVTRYWPAIGHLAAELLDAQELDGQRAEAIFARHGQACPAPAPRMARYARMARGRISRWP